MIGSVLNIKQLEALVWVADLGSFRKAAAHLNTTQPNISARIAALEKTLDVVLMQRNAGNIQLTENGREIRDAALAVLRGAEKIVDIAGRPDLVADKLRLGVTELVACTWLHAYLRDIKRAYPALNVELTVDLSRNLDQALAAKELDLAVQTAPFAAPASAEVALGEFPYIWVANRKIAQALAGPSSLADLLPHTILTHARHTQAYGELAAYVAAKALPTSRIVASTSLAACVQMAADGMGVTLLPSALVDRERAEQRLFAVDVDWLPSPLRFAARFRSEGAPAYLEHCAKLAVSAATTG